MKLAERWEKDPGVFEVVEKPKAPVKESRMYTLTDEDRALLADMREVEVPDADFARIIEKSSTDHFYGAWRGGKASAGGGPATGGMTAEQAVDALAKGKPASVAPGDVAAVMDIVAKRDDHLDLTELQVDGTLKFGGDGLGIARKDMPQLAGDDLVKYLDRLRGQGIKVTMGKIDPQKLKPIQKEVSATNAAKIVKSLREHGYDPSKSVVVTKDNYVLDGHHRWGAVTAFSFEPKGKGVQISFVRIGMNAKELLPDANKWTASQGIASRALGESTFYTLTESDRAVLRSLEEKSGDHFYGSWKGGKASGGGGPSKPSDYDAFDSPAPAHALRKKLTASTGVTHAVGLTTFLTPGAKYAKSHYVVAPSANIQSAVAGYRDASLRAAGPVKEALEGGHFYGAWKGGSAKSGGGPAGAAGGNTGPALDDEKGILAFLGPVGSMKDGVLHILGKPATPGEITRLNEYTAAERKAARLTKIGQEQADAFTKALPKSLAPRRALMQEASSDHFYGAWKGGSAKGGGAPADSPDGRAITATERWATTKELVTDMESKYPGTDWSPMNGLDPVLASAAADQIDTMFDRYGVVPSFRGIKTPEHGGNVLAEVKRITPGVPGSAVYLPKDHWGSKAAMDKSYEQAKLSPTWAVSNTTGSTTAYARAIVAHEMGHEYLGLNLHSRLGADRNAPVRKELEPWLHDKFLPNLKKAHVSKYARTNEHEAWAEVFSAASGYGSSGSHYVGELKAILDKHYPVPVKESAIAEAKAVSAKDPPGQLCGWAQRHPDVTQASPEDIGEVGSFARLTEKSGDHFYGAWKGGKAGAGGGHAESTYEPEDKGAEDPTHLDVDGKPWKDAAGTEGVMGWGPRGQLNDKGEELLSRKKAGKYEKYAVPRGYHDVVNGGHWPKGWEGGEGIAFTRPSKGVQVFQARFKDKTVIAQSTQYGSGMHHVDVGGTRIGNVMSGTGSKHYADLPGESGTRGRLAMTYDNKPLAVMALIKRAGLADGE